MRSEEDIDNHLVKLNEDKEKKENSVLEDPLHELTSQVTTIKNSLSEVKQIIDRVPNFKVFEENPSPPKNFECYIFFDSTNLKVPNSFFMHASKDPLEVHLPKYGRNFGVEPKIEVIHDQISSIPKAKIWWKSQRKKVKKKEMFRALKLKKQKYAVPHCLPFTPNFKTTRCKTRKMKKIHGVVSHFNDPPSSSSFRHSLAHDYKEASKYFLCFLVFMLFLESVLISFMILGTMVNKDSSLGNSLQGMSHHASSLFIDMYQRKFHRSSHNLSLHVLFVMLSLF